MVMPFITKFMRLPSHRRRLVVKTTALLVIVRVGLRLFAYQKMHDVLERLARPGKADIANGSVSDAEIVWAVSSAAARLPGTTCLPRALVGRYLMLRAGCPARIRFGVGKQSDGTFAAHAWLESRDRILLGGETMLDYSPMPVWPPDAA
jgi:hypothetical protein